MLDIFRSKPDYDLNIMEPRQTLSTITSKCLLGMEEVLEQAKPDLVLVHGDTSTTFAGPWPPSTTRSRWAMWRPACGPMIKWSPFPEEMNRTDGGGHRRPPLLPHPGQPGEPGAKGSPRASSSPATR